MAKIIRIPTCEKCIHAFVNKKSHLKSYLICGNIDIYGTRPVMEDRIVSKTKIPKWCLLEEDNERKRSSRRTIKK